MRPLQVVLLCLVRGIPPDTHGGTSATQLVYVIAWVAVQFGMNCTSNATRKESIARGEAECYLPSWLHYECNSSQNCTATHAVTN